MIQRAFITQWGTVVPFSVQNDWISGQCDVVTYELDELVGTKVRALYQRLKGRDLFDVYTALDSGKLDLDRVMTAYDRYLRFVACHAPHLQGIRAQYGREDAESGVPRRHH
ncbi:MAG: nucleotidyl transferase AbiEii/AbiGii toxin family protein [Bacteroidales bacterium]|nr:nucleotidyl transferase AbiEii/AbiGii toxin family protein [Bacteroidales bacterium]